jgi:hypothetical protein
MALKKKKIRTITLSKVGTINLLIFLLSLATLLAGCKLTATKASDGAKWEQEAKEANKTQTGLDVIIVRDGKIAALFAFLDSMPPR